MILYVSGSYPIKCGANRNAVLALGQVFWGMIMRTWILAAVAALAVGQAEATTLRVNYVSTSGTTVSFDPIESEEWFPDEPGPDLRVRFFISYGNLYPNKTYSSTSTDGLLVYQKWTYPDGSVFSYPISTSSVIYGFKTDAAGKIEAGFLDAPNIYLTVGSVGSLYADGASYGNTTAGYWTFEEMLPGQVPLPATAPMLIGAVALLGLRRRVRE